MFSFIVKIECFNFNSKALSNSNALILRLCKARNFRLETVNFKFSFSVFVNLKTLNFKFSFSDLPDEELQPRGSPGGQRFDCRCGSCWDHSHPNLRHGKTNQTEKQIDKRSDRQTDIQTNR